MAKGAKPPADGDNGGNAGQESNVPDGAKLADWIARVENLDNDILAEKGESKARLTVITEDRKQAIEDAEADGVSKTTLKAHLKRRKLERKIGEVRDDLQGSHQDRYDVEMLALEKLGPLGQAALKAA